MVRIVIYNLTAAALRLLEMSAICLGVLKNHDGLSVSIFCIGRFDCDTKCITGVRRISLFAAVHRLQTLHRERTDAQRNIVDSEAMLHQDLIHCLAPLRGNAIAIQCLDVWIKNFVTFAVHGTTKNFPQFEHRLGYNLHGVAAVTANSKTSMVLHHILFNCGENIIDQVPIVIAVTDHREVLVRIDFFQ